MPNNVRNQGFGTTAELAATNPYLAPQETWKDTTLARTKTGPGLWNDLSFDDQYAEDHGGGSGTSVSPCVGPFNFTFDDPDLDPEGDTEGIKSLFDLAVGDVLASAFVLRQSAFTGSSNNVFPILGTFNDAGSLWGSGDLPLSGSYDSYFSINLQINSDPGNGYNDVAAGDLWNPGVSARDDMAAGNAAGLQLAGGTNAVVLNASTLCLKLVDENGDFPSMSQGEADLYVIRYKPSLPV